MQKIIYLPFIDLHLFDGAAAAAPATGSEGAPQDGNGTAPKAEVKGRSGGSRRSRSGEQTVVYGIQEDAPGAEATPSDAGGGTGQGASKSGVSTTSDTLEAKRKAFEELIDGEYKDIYAEKFQTAFNRRHREAKEMEQAIAAQKPVLDMLMQRYGIADGDMGKLQTAIEQDDKIWEGAAEKAGVTVEQFRANQKLQMEVAQLRQANQRLMGEQQAQQQLARWDEEGKKVKELYPTFDFRAEAANRDFLGLLRSGVPVQKAYELMHMDEIKESAARAAAQTAGERMKANIQRRAARPIENGTSSQSAVIVKNDVHSLSREDRAEIARRAQRGEKIRF